MTTEKMTVHKALAELKTLDARIDKAISDVDYVCAVKHSAEKINGKTLADFKADIKSGYQKARDLMARREAMKRAVVLSNAATMVRIGDKELTVAEAIELKNHGVEFKRQMFRRISSMYEKALADLERNSGEALERRAEAYVLSVIQAQPKESRMAVDSEAMNALRKTYIENNGFDLIDPLDVSKVMAALEAEIRDFETEVDAALSTSNALTVLEFSY